MLRLDRRHWIAGMAAVGLGVAGYQLWPRDETRIAGLLGDLCAKFNEMRDPGSLAELKTALNAALLPDATLRVPEVGIDVRGRESIGHNAVGALLAAGVRLSFALSGMQVHVDGNAASVGVDVLVMPLGSGEQRRELRPARVTLNKVGTNWQIEMVQIDPVAASQPEARP